LILASDQNQGVSFIFSGEFIMDAFTMTYEVRWTDIDANRYVRLPAYIDAAVELRYRFFAQDDLPPEAFDQLRVGRLPAVGIDPPCAA
jgi:hypothetical protein